MNFVTFFLYLVASIYIMSAVATTYYTYCVYRAIGKFTGVNTYLMDLLTGPVGTARIAFGYQQLALALAEYQAALSQRRTVGSAPVSAFVRPSKDTLN